MERCDDCKANKVCDHNRFGFENCGNFITADVVPTSEEGAECPTCHGTGRIGTTDWLTKDISKKKLAEEKAKAIAEHEQYIKTEYAMEIFEEIERFLYMHFRFCKEEIGNDDTEYVKGRLELNTQIQNFIVELKKKYT